MCGITGFIDFTKCTSSEVLGRMTRSLSHRGPDDHGELQFDNELCSIGMSQTRLSIIDLSPLGHQPMVADNYTIVFNGEIYNFMEIRKVLEESGSTFISRSDTEVILKAFQKWGISCLERFRGMFSFVIYDRRDQKIWLVRDRAGVKPFYYYYDQGLFLFASELKAFHEHPGFKKEIDTGSLALFLEYNYIPAPACIFRNAKKIQPGYYLEISLADKSINEVCYWDVWDAYKKPKLNITPEEAKSETERILTESFNYRMVADVPVGIFLSGGFDSSAVASLLQKDRTEKLKTFTIGFDVGSFDEAPFARQVAAHLETDHTEYYCTANDAFSIIPKLPEIFDEPFADNSVVPTVLVSQLARKSVTVALSGDGGDEIFAGYDKFNRSINFARGWGPPKRFLSKMMSWINPDHLPVLNSSYNFSTRFEKIRLILESNDPKRILKLISQQIPDTEVKRIINKPFEEYKTQFELGREGTGQDTLDSLLAIDYLTFLTDNNLAKIDRATMSVGLEGREPFLDQNIVEFVARLPSDLKIRNGVNKYILKEIVYKYLPKQLMDREKKPFLAPLSVWFLDQLKEFFLHYLDESVIMKEGYFNPEPILTMRKQFLAGKPIKHQKLWNILIFEMWYERWMKQ